jgi:hypothetical protein
MELLEKELNKKGLSVNSEGVAKFGSLDLYGVFLDALRAVDSSNADKYKLTEARREALYGIVRRSFDKRESSESKEIITSLVRGDEEKSLSYSSQHLLGARSARV